MRVLVAIGCDIYDEMRPLGGAEADANAVFQHLVVNGWGDYHPTNSRLLLSPSLVDVRDALTTALFDIKPLDELTLFFAGHGAVKDDAYFLCLRDTVFARMTVSALSLATLFGWISEARVRQTNIVLDACQAGGVTRDIGYLLSPGVMGSAGSPGMSILAASASDQDALEVGGRGLCTIALMKCLKGETKVQSTRPTLDLVEVGRLVASEFKEANQQPVSWGLNLVGRGQFAKNPHFGGGKPHIEDMLPPQEDPEINAIASRYAPSIWKCYSTIHENFDATAFANAIRPGLMEIAARSLTSASIFLEGVNATFGPTLRSASNIFAETEMHACCAGVWLDVANGTGPDRDFCTTLLRRVYQSGTRAVQETVDSILQYKYNLLGLQTGLPDLFYLPNRLVRLLGWIGALEHTASLIGANVPPAFATLEQLILELYCTSIVCISDEQAPFWTSYISSPVRSAGSEFGEQFLGLLFASLLESDGVLARPLISGGDAFEFMKARSAGEIPNTLVARPSCFLATLLISFRIFQIDYVADGLLREIDHANINIYVPPSIAHFDREEMEGGTNFSNQIGHHIFNVHDLISEFRQIAIEMAKDPLLGEPINALAALYCSLIWPDRVAWHMLMAPLGMDRDELLAYT